MEFSIKRNNNMRRNGLFTRNLDDLDPVAMTIAKNIMEKRKQALAAMPDQIKEEAPPGREDQVKELKKKFPKEKAFAIAWASYNKSHNEEVEPVNELSKEKLGAYRAKASPSHTDAVLSKDKKKLSKRTIGLGRARALMKDEKLFEELLDEATRKHFRMVADLLKNIPDQGKRKEMAHQHAQIFSQQNPRFDHKKFMQAAGVSEK
jgi:hypothetical protein